MSTLGPETRGPAGHEMPGFMPATVFDDSASEGARSYAEALLNAASRGGSADGVLDELEELRADVWEGQPRFAALLASPIVGHEEKDRVLARAFEGRAQAIVVRFLRVLNRHGRLGLLPQIVHEARTLWDRRQGRRPVTVRSAAPLDDGFRESLRGRLAGLVGATPVVRYEVDPALIGGLIVQVGDEIYDASIRTRLQRLRQQLVESRVRDLGRLRGSAVEAPSA